MFTADLTVKNKTGLHARPASQLVMLSQKFESEILISFGDENDRVEVDPKSIISILSAGIGQGTPITLSVNGPDEETAGPALVEFIDSLTE